MTQQNINQEQEIDLFAIIQKFWNARKFILLCFLVCVFFGFFYAILSPNQYTSETIFTTQSSGKSKGLGGLGGLIGLPSVASAGSNEISSELYPTLIESTPFLKRMMYSQVYVPELETEIPYYEYHSQYVPENPLVIIRKYTIGLPSLLFSSSKKEGENLLKIQGVESQTSEELKMFSVIKSQVIFDAKPKDDALKLAYVSGNPVISAQMLRNAQIILQEIITELKIRKAKEKMDFIEQRYQEAKNHFDQIQLKWAAYKDANREFVSSLPQTRKTQLETDYNLAYTTFLDLSKSLEAQKIQVKEDTPVFTIIQPVRLPTSKSNASMPKVLVIFGAIGFILGCFLVLLKMIFNFFRENIQA